MTINKRAEQILLILFRDIFIIHTATSLAKILGMSRWGVWKILKELENNRLIMLNQMGGGKTSVHIVKLNFGSVILSVCLAFALSKESLKYERWKANFKELAEHTEFLILYGSILHSPKEANDIDILGVISDKGKFVKINHIIDKAQKTQAKKIHSLNFTPEEFMYEIKKSNKAFIDSVKKGVILYGQEKFVKFIMEIHKK